MKNQIFRLQEKSNLILFQRKNWRQFPPLTKFFIVDDGTGARKHYQDCKTLKEAQTIFKPLTP